MKQHWAVSLMERIGVERRVINGCEEHGGGRDNKLLTRYFVKRTERFGNLYLHVFHRSDFDRELHDHPWCFVSIILSNGYIEHTPRGAFRKTPGMILLRPAKWLHRVELVNDRPSVSLVWVGKRKRIWGFLTALGWVPFTRFFDEKGC